MATQKELKARYDAGDKTVSKYVQKVYYCDKIYEYDCYRESQWDSEKHNPKDNTTTTIIPEAEFYDVYGVKWKKIPNTRVWCSEDGKHIAKWVMCNQKFREYYQKDEHGYKTISIVINKKHYCTTSHRIIAYCFGLLDSLDSKMDVDHIDNNRSNNAVSNLQVISHKENCKKRDANGSAKAKKIILSKDGKEYMFDSCSEAAKWFIEMGIAKGTFESVKGNISVCAIPYGYNKRFID